MLKSSDRVFQSLTLHNLHRVGSGALVDDDSGLILEHNLLLRSSYPEWGLWVEGFGEAEGAETGYGFGRVAVRWREGSEE
ncbi:hypothetical protein C1H46_023540 [Malus baccata]|uniref:Uncharacterized protein n=1 Tax=Malus baccata TaxID=106549 RepID=A0A540LWS3_MALBA|nr:hypothetical protein C1H46_023540 [Malus baccata]